MTFQNPRSGPNNVAEYQASGLPWVTGALVLSTTPVRIDFPYVTNAIHFHVYNHGSNVTMRFGFTENGVNGSNFGVIHDADGWATFDFRCKTIFVRADTGTVTCSIAAGLTTIDQRTFPILTSSAVYNTGTLGNVFGYGIPGTPGAGTGLG